MGLLFESWILDLVALLAGIFGLLHVYISWNFDYWKKRGVPFLKPSPFFGNTKDMILARQCMGETFRDFYNDFAGKSYGGIFQGRMPVFIVRDPELIKLVLLKDFSHFMNHSVEFDEEANPVDSKNLFSLTGHRWREMRVKLTPTFTSGKMKRMFHLMKECGDEMKAFLEEPAKRGDVLEMKDLLGKYTTNVIGSCAFGIECNTFKDPDSVFRKMGKRMMNLTIIESIKMLIFFVMPKLALFLKISISSNEVNQFFISLVKETMDYREKNHVVRNDFMQLLIELKKKGHVEIDKEEEDEIEINELEPETEKPFTMDDLDITGQVKVFFAAGFETSSTMMSFLLYELALNPDIQKRLREEINGVLEEHGGNVTYASIQQMKYLDNVISETLRKYPPSPFHMRYCNKTYTIPGTDVTIDEGTTLNIPVYGLHYDPQYFPDPEKFDPDRFTEENKKARPNYTYLPFGEGPRICIGMRFALMQSKIGLVSLLRDYELKVCEKTIIPMVLDPKGFILTQKGGNWLQIVEASNK